MTDRIEHPFSNGTEGSAWTAAWCANCLHDHATHDDEDYEHGCPLLAHSYGGHTPLVWQPMERDFWHTLPAGITCRAFERCDCAYEDIRAPARRMPVRLRLHVRATAAAMRAWADLHGEVDTQGIEPDEWMALAVAVITTQEAML